MGTKLNPGNFDCYANAAPDEEMFVLLGRDVAAPEAIRLWCNLRVANGLNQWEDKQIVEAMECARRMLTAQEREGRKAPQLQTLTGAGTAQAPNKDGWMP